MTPLTPADEARQKLQELQERVHDSASDFPIDHFPITEEEVREEIQASIDASDLAFRKSDVDVLLSKLYERTEIGLIPAEGVFTGHDFYDEVTVVDIMQEVADQDPDLEQ